MAGKTISHYQILEKLGEGGMGVVYKAEDLKLKRTVALKFLPAHAVEDPEFKQRFVREAQAAASLQHPNIATVFELDEEHGFLAMELVEGPSLKDRIRERPLKLEDALLVAAEVGAGLKVAHEHGIVHRDIKSGNILLTPEGQAKITDFGLATLVDRSRVTKTGAALGTPGYMAPEQARGEKVDGRADLWALGVVLYEMLSGRLPFGGDSDAAIVHSILHDEAEPLTAQRAGLPIDVDRIIAKCLAKAPGERYQHIDDLLVDLRRCTSTDAAAGSTRGAVPEKQKWLMPSVLAGRRAFLATAVLLLASVIVGIGIRYRERSAPVPTTTPGKPSVAVLPFLNLSADPENQYFSDGMTEEIISKLSRIQGLAIASRTSVARFKGTQKDIKEIGRELGVRYLLEGSVRKEASRVRTTAQLIDTSTGFHLWAEDFNRDLKDVFAVQEETALKIVEALNLRLSPQERQAVQRRYTENAQAYDAYLRGRALVEFFDNPEKLQAARRYFEQALESDPNYPLALVGLSRVEGQYYRNLDATPARLQRAEQLAQRALALDAGQSEAYVAIGSVHGYRYDYTRAAEEFRKAVRLEPGNAYAWDLLAWALAYQQPPQGQAAEAAAREAIRLQPNLAGAHYHLGRTLLVQRRYQEAIAAFSHALELDPSLRAAFLGLGEVDLAQGNYGRALAELGRAPRTPLVSFQTSALFAAQGDKEEALATLEKALAGGYRDFAAIDANPHLASLRSEPRFQQLMRKYRK